ncbi:MAG TPA: bifunctional folylpolyglutamate synthase/dihydrofolate synthase, partial [Verrucomicrobiae bacterium]|nr:bifunctional folylpolyglutamate synthase/dihydrofolate synthase [Verrucomicrobiae bacterium]
MSGRSRVMARPGPADDPTIGAAYHDALDALAERGRFGIRLGLGRTRALLRELDDPQLGIRGALVGGTNGKGSVLALAGSALRAAGLRAGETPKPHLVSYRERLQIGGRPVDAATFTRLVGDAIAAADRIPRRLGPPTEFELLTAIVFRWFADEGVDLAIVEVGLGGRLDATHAWDGGVAAITNVDLDHMDRLGPTIAHIAR